MPLVMIKSNAELGAEAGEALAGKASGVVAEVIGKPEQYVMAVYQQADMVMSGEGGPAAFLDVRSIGGLSGSVPADLSKKLSDLLEAETGIPASRVYLNCTDVSASSWGWNGSTFG
jgi:phenylpyruvate tautomerase PptA (4-oxalocrotonate tautomerase family)